MQWRLSNWYHELDKCQIGEEIRILWDNMQHCFEASQGEYQCECGALGTCHGLPVLWPKSRIQQQQLDGPIPEPPESTALVGDDDECVDKDRSNGAGAGYDL